MHDNNIFAYSIDCGRRRLILHTEYEFGDSPEFTDVVFTGVIAYQFEHVLPGNILGEIEQVQPDEIVDSNASLFADSWRWGWPEIVYDGDLDRLKQQLRDRGACGFMIDSSYGLNGWVLAEKCERLKGSAEPQPYSTGEAGAKKSAPSD